MTVRLNALHVRSLSSLLERNRGKHGHNKPPMRGSIKTNPLEVFYVEPILINYMACIFNGNCTMSGGHSNMQLDSGYKQLPIFNYVSAD